MKKYVISCVLVFLSIGLTSPAFAGEVTVLAPTVLDWGQAEARFEVPAAGAAVLTMVNGAGTPEIVTSGSVFLNEGQVLGREDFELDQLVVQKVVTLQEGENKLFFRNRGTQRGGRIQIEIAALADRIEIVPISDALVAGEENLIAEATLTALGLPVEDADLLFVVEDLGEVPAVESSTDADGVAVATLSGFAIAGMGTLQVHLLEDPSLNATTPLEVVLVPAIDLDQGLTNLVLEVGVNRHLSYGIEVNETDGQPQDVTFTQVLQPDNGGISLTSDYPGGWTTSTPQTFLVNQVLTGLVPGSYTLTSTATITATGQSRSRELQIEVVESLVGELELHQPGSEPPALSLEEKTHLVFTVLATGVDEFPTSLILEEIDGDGLVIGTLGELFDDGNGGDLVSGDRVYTGTFPIEGGAEGKRYFRAVSVHEGGAVSSPTFGLPVTRFPTAAVPSDPTTWVEDPTNNTVMPSNEILVAFVEGLSADQIETLVASEGGSIVGFLPSLGVFQVRIQGDGTAAGVQAAIEAFEAHPEVEFAEANAVARTGAVPPDSSQQWGAVRIRADEAWVTARSSALVVAVVDAGVDYNHTDLSGKVIQGKDFFNNDNDPLDDLSHGTHVAGIIGAKHNGNGVTGIAHGARILAVKITNAQGDSNWTALASGIRYAADQGAKVINVSMQSSSGSTLAKKAVEYASKKGSLVVGSAGNFGTSNKSYPGAYAKVFCVGNTTQSDGRAGNSGFGSWVDIAAPGSGIYSTVLNNGYGFDSGTSMAAPHVAGAAAVLWTLHPSWSASQVRERLEKTAKNLPASLNLGAGRLDLFEAVFNGSFEIGNLAEWTSTGTCSSLKKLGPTALDPRHEKRMGYCSTGPAGDQVAANLRKTFTVQAGVTSLPIRFDYNFVSEEFPEFVGTQFNDALEITLTSPGGTETQLAMETINGSVFALIGGVDFPGGDTTVGHTGWKTAFTTVPVTEGQWTLQIRISDAGDDIYDSIVLIDHIRLK